MKKNTLIGSHLKIRIFCKNCRKEKRKKIFENKTQKKIPLEKLYVFCWLFSVFNPMALK